MAGRVDISRGEHNFNPLQHAAYHHNDVRFIKPLITAGCPVDCRTYESSGGTGGHTPLARAILLTETLLPITVRSRREHQ